MMNRTTWIIIGALCLIGLGSLVYITKKETVNVDSVDPTAIIASSNGIIGDHVYGNKDAKVVVFEYADFQCPGCAGAHQNTPKIQLLYKDKVAFIFRNFPLTSIHPNALAAATVAEAAGQQGKYWEMNNLLFANRDEWVNLTAEQRGSTFESYASQLGLNIDQFKSDLTSSIIQRKIQTDRGIAGKLGINSTPTFYIGSTKVDDATVTDVIQNSGTKLMDKIDQALKDAGETPPARS